MQTILTEAITAHPPVPFALLLWFIINMLEHLHLIVVAMEEGKFLRKSLLVNSNVNNFLPPCWEEGRFSGRGREMRKQNGRSK